MSKLVDIVEHELAHHKRLQDNLELQDYSRAVYADIACTLGIYGPEDVRLSVIRFALVDLYHYFCYLYGIDPNPEYADEVHPYTLRQRRRFTHALLAYWRTEDHLRGPYLNGDSDIRVHLKQLQVLTGALDMIEEDPRIEFPQRPPPPVRPSVQSSPALDNLGSS